MTTIVLLGLLGLLVLLVIVGFCLPSKVTVLRATTIDRPVEAVFPWVAELKLWPQWTVWNAAEDPSLNYTYPGPTTGRGGAMHWTAKKMGDGNLTFTEFEPNKTIRYELRMPSHGTNVQGNIEFESAGGGATGVTWYDEVDLGANPFKHLLGPVLKGMLGKAFARSLAGLKIAAMTGKASGPGPK